MTVVESTQQASLAQPGRLGEGLVAYGEWRADLSRAIRGFSEWLDGAGLAHAPTRARLQALVERLADERVSVAFVAEFSRGKSELINAIFFSGYGQRVVPTSAGRTTMCPTELMYDPSRPPSIRLLPIETRFRDEPLSEFRRRPDEWREIAFDASDRRSVIAALASVRETRHVREQEAAALGLHEDGETPVDASGLVEIPRWRHAIVNIPDPLLETGLVVIDTPGLNAIGNEPELALSVIPGADAVLFVVAADAGVTRSDVEVWRRHIDPSHGAGRFVVLNKIDGLWDDLRDESQVELEIAQQVASVARTLDVPHERIFPVSAQKGLVARVQGDRALARRSRLADLERALSRELVAQRRTFLRERVAREFDAACDAVLETLDSRCAECEEQLADLSGLRGRNRDVTSHMAAGIKVERASFERSLRRLRALRNVYARTSQSMYARIGVRSLRRHVRNARDAMSSASFSVGLRDAMARLLADARADFEAVEAQVDEITELMDAMYAAFGIEGAGGQAATPRFSLERHLAELARVESVYRDRFGAVTLVTTEKWVLMRRFFESVAARLREVYALAGSDLESWLRAVIAPVETRVRERHARLRRRLESVRRVLDATESLDARIAEIGRARVEAEKQRAHAREVAAELRAILERPFPEPSERA